MSNNTTYLCIGTILTMYFLACIYGDIMKVDTTTGASEATAKQDKLTVIKGVEASKKLAENDLTQMEKWQWFWPHAALFGLFCKQGQLMRHETNYRIVEKDQEITEASFKMINRMNAKCQSVFTASHYNVCFGGISAFNAGVMNVQTYERMDVGTTGGDYSNDVVARAQWFKSKGY
uniref:Uncharacterized protein n=1 Tax=Sinocyclocheilus rhinocerous TaxID=307959 RepID=A0A673FLR1_9TELE